MPNVSRKFYWMKDKFGVVVTPPTAGVIVQPTVEYPRLHLYLFSLLRRYFIARRRKPPTE